MANEAEIDKYAPKKDDEGVLASDHFRSYVMTPNSSHLLRRPGVGISEAVLGTR